MVVKKEKFMKKKIIVMVAIVALIVILGTVLVACNNEKDYRKRLQDAGYEIMNKEQVEQISGGNIDAELCEWIVAGFKMSIVSIVTENSDMVVIYKFKNESDAKDVYNELSADAENDSTLAVERKGKIIIFGTKQGVKDAQGK